MDLGDEDEFRRRAEVLEVEVEQLTSATARCRSDTTLMRAELAAVQSLLHDAEVERARLQKMKEPAESGGKLGSMGGEQERSMEVCALEAQLVTTKVGLAQARFERDSLQSEVRRARKKLAALAPVRHGERAARGLERHLRMEEDPDVLASEVAMRIGSVYQAGTLHARPCHLKFFPIHGRALLRRDEELDVVVTEEDTCFINAFNKTDGAVAQLLSIVEIRVGDDRVYRLVGFRSGMSYIHSCMKEYLMEKSRKASPAQNSVREISALPKSFAEEGDFLQRFSGELRAGSAPAVIHEMKPKESLGPYPEPVFTHDMSNPSEVLEPSHCAKLILAIPARFRTGHWQMLYSTSFHGYSLHTFYLKVAKTSPTLLAVRESKGHVFGCYAAAAWKLSATYYGTGETFLFSAEPTFEVYRWTHANSFFQLSSHDSLAIGGGGK